VMITTSTRITLNNILFATDFSAPAERALPFAGELATRFGAKLLIVHAKTPLNYAMAPEAWQPAPDEGIKAELQELRGRLAKSFPEVRSETLVAEGAVWEAVASILAKQRIDLLVLGTRGRTGLGKLLLGSQAEEILRRAPCPVLTVGPHSETEAGRLKSVLYATDFGPESQAAVPYAISIAQENQAELTLLHVIEAPKTGELVLPPDLQTSTATVLRAIVPEEAKFWCEPRCVVEEGKPAEKILDVAGRYRAGLIVLGAKKPTGVPGAATHLSMATVHQVVTHAHCPVLTVRGG